MTANIMVPLSIFVVVVVAIGIFICLKSPHWPKRALGVTVVIVAVVAMGLVLSSYAYQKGYDTALSHQALPLSHTLDALDQIHAGNVEGAIRLTEENCFWLANELLEERRYQSDLGGITAFMPRLTMYWDTYCADRTERAWTEKRFAELLSQRR